MTASRGRWVGARSGLPRARSGLPRAVFALTAAALSGCLAAGTAGVIVVGGSGGGGGGGAAPAAPAPALTPLTIPAIAGGDVTLVYRLAEPGHRPADVRVEVAVAFGGPFAPATEATALGSEGTTGLDTSPGGSTHVFVWNSFADTAAQNLDVSLRLQAFDAATGTPGDAVEVSMAVANAFVQSPLQVGSVDPTQFGIDPSVAVVRDASGEAKAFVIADPQQHRIWRFDVGTGDLAVLAGTGVPGFGGDDIPATEAFLASPLAVAVDAAGHVYIGDSANDRVRRVDAVTGFITTVAGGVEREDLGDGEVATAAALDPPRALAVDANGNLYVAESDTDDQRVRVVNRTSQPIMVAGKTIEPATIETVLDLEDVIALLESIPGLDPGLGGGVLLRRSFEGIAVRGVPGNGPSAVEVYVSESGSRTVLRLDSSSTVPELFVGPDTPGPVVVFPAGLALLEAGPRAELLIADTGASVVLSRALGGGATSTAPLVVVAGQRGQVGFDGDGGPPLDAVLNRPQGVAVATVDGQALVVIADTGNQIVRVLNLPDQAGVTVGGIPVASGPEGTIETVAGALLEEPGAAPPALLVPAAVVVLDDLTIVASDFLGGAIVSIDPITRAVRTLATGLLAPAGLAVIPNGDDPPQHVAVAETGGHRVLRVPLEPDDEPPTRDELIAEGGVLAGTGVATGSKDGDVLGGERADDNLGDGGPATDATLHTPAGVAIEDLGGGAFRLYVADTFNSRIRVIDEDQVIRTYVNDQTALDGDLRVVVVAGFDGDGPRLGCALAGPIGVAIDADAEDLLITDSGNHLVRRVSLEPPDQPSSAEVVTIAGRIEVPPPPAQAGPVSGYNGDNRPALGASLSEPSGILAADGDVYFADRANQRVRRVRQGIIDTVIGTGQASFNGDGKPAVNTALNDPTGVALQQGALYIADPANLRIRRHAK